MVAGLALESLKALRQKRLEIEPVERAAGSKLKTVFLIRHGESEWNVAQRQFDVVGMFGQFDHGLTNRGARQAEALRRRVRGANKTDAARLEFEGATRVYCSPLTRAVQTALIALAGHRALRDRGLTLADDLRELVYPVGGFDSIKRNPLDASLRRARDTLGPRLAGQIERGRRYVDDEVAAAWYAETRRGAASRLARFVFTTLCGPEGDDDPVIVVGHSLFFMALVNNFASEHLRVQDPVARRLATSKLDNAAVARLTLNCSEPRYPVVAVEMCFTAVA
ncbi:hypothetical protein CTAYLR_005901 [Chrysophaeum taylorii]|uniref:Uncharacterized protein n=1 Tax=Chrysophaeum taylorii TaxID=2483200 RepID=A0AAD7XNN0_9STRA|nr:hypothetical protein CTAYLR_005874 [Chrysophaeum taylorii]KAJ8614316.1 hypothetical protein CTAYLR_005901 [Chrysophaeum taylorii]